VTASGLAALAFEDDRIGNNGIYIQNVNRDCSLGQKLASSSCEENYETFKWGLYPSLIGDGVLVFAGDSGLRRQQGKRSAGHP
jgi:hypothetical protein